MYWVQVVLETSFQGLLVEMEERMGQQMLLVVQIQHLWHQLVVVVVRHSHKEHRVAMAVHKQQPLLLQVVLEFQMVMAEMEIRLHNFLLVELVVQEGEKSLAQVLRVEKEEMVDIMVEVVVS